MLRQKPQVNWIYGLILSLDKRVLILYDRRHNSRIDFDMLTEASCDTAQIIGRRERSH